MMGLDIFKEYFRDYAQQYVLIGGAACDIIFEERQNCAFGDYCVVPHISDSLQGKGMVGSAR